jgi:hypothetical protein
LTDDYLWGMAKAKNPEAPSLFAIFSQTNYPFTLQANLGAMAFESKRTLIKRKPV